MSLRVPANPGHLSQFAFDRQLLGKSFCDGGEGLNQEIDQVAQYSIKLATVNCWIKFSPKACSSNLRSVCSLLAVGALEHEYEE